MAGFFQFRILGKHKDLETLLKEEPSNLSVEKDN